MASSSTLPSAPESKRSEVDTEDVKGILSAIIKSSKLALKSSDNLDTFNLLQLYNKYLEVFNENFMDKSEYEIFLVKGKRIKEFMKETCRTQKTTATSYKSINIVMVESKNIKGSFTFSRFCACVAYNYYEHVVSKLDSLEEMITPSLITPCSKLPMDTGDEDSLKYNKLFCLAVSGVHFIPKMMKNVGKSDDLIGGVFTICLLIDYTQYKRNHPTDKVEFKTFLNSDRYRDNRHNFIDAVRNYGKNDLDELMAKKSSFKMLKLFMEQGCTIELKGEALRRNGRAAMEMMLKSFSIE